LRPRPKYLAAEPSGCVSEDDAFKRVVNQLQSATAILAERAQSGKLTVVGSYDLYTERVEFLKL
jgi:hypothetical protein